jgi:two-component system chemotaxis response regulator CheB
MIKVLVVDDSPTLRHFTRAILESDPGLQVVGLACNGEEAVALCEELQPDIVTMDIRMPKMNGFQAIRRIMAESPRPILVLTSTRSDVELGISFKAIEAGALMIVGKPHGLPGEDPEADRLIEQVKAMAWVKVVRRRRPPEEATPKLALPGKRPAPSEVEGPALIRLIAIGASTGGPPALQVIFSQLPSSLPVVVVQHISPGFVPGLARWLDGTTPLRVKVARDGERLQPGTAYLAPDRQHLLVGGNERAHLSDSAPVDGHRPSVTTLFESVARHYGPAAVGVLLTGMGRDGARGLKALRDAGACTIAQDSGSCVVFGMPKEAIALGAAGEVLPLEKIGDRLAELMTPCLSQRPSLPQGGEGL